MPCSWPRLSLRTLMWSDSGSVGMTENLGQVIPFAGTIVAGCVGIKSRSLPRGVAGWPRGALEPAGHAASVPHAHHGPPERRCTEVARCVESLEVCPGASPAGPGEPWSQQAICPFGSACPPRNPLQTPVYRKSPPSWGFGLWRGWGLAFVREGETIGAVICCEMGFWLLCDTEMEALGRSDAD